MGALRLLQQRIALPPPLHSSTSSFNCSYNNYCRSYVSRAHPKPVPEIPVGQALEHVLEGVKERMEKRAAKWERNISKKATATTTIGGPYRNQDETIEIAINLNVDPRRPGQALRGSIVLPHGTGKQSVKCLVFTNDEVLAKEAAAAGVSGASCGNEGRSTVTAGGETLLEQILAGEIAVDDYERALCTKDILQKLQKQLARLLGPRGLMPNAKTNTVFENAESQDLLKTLREQSSTVTYRTDPNGILHFVVGKGSFTPQQLLDNMQAIFQTIQDAKPEQYGKGKKNKGGKGMGKNVKYWLRAHLTATQGKGSIRMDLRTVDPTSPFFMKEPE